MLFPLNPAPCGIRRVLAANFVIRIISLLALVMVATSAWGALATDVTVSTDRSTPAGSITSPTFSTKAGNELLLAFVSTDAQFSSITVPGVTGAGLTWMLVQRTNAQLGTAEVWRAFTPAVLSGVTVTATLSQSVAASITVVSFTGADPSGTSGSGAIGHTGSGNGSSGAPMASLTTTRANSWVWGVGNDWDNAIGRTVGSNQTLAHQYLAAVGDTYWVQRETATTAVSGTMVTINDTAPTSDRYNLSIVEVLPAPVATGSFTASGSISPANFGSGTIVSLSGAGSGSATADTSGNYVFPNLGNGMYAVTPNKPGFAFTPASQSFTISGANWTIAPFTAVQTWTLSGTITPASLGSGTPVILTGPVNLTTKVDTSGNYSFSGLVNGSYTVSPSQSGVTFTPPNRSVPINGNNMSGINFTAQAVPLYPDLRDIIPQGNISVVQTSGGKLFQYTHDTFNGGPGPLVIQPVYNAASGTYQGTQYIYTLNAGVWTISQQIPIAGAFIFDSDHGHFHFPFVTYGLYTVSPSGGIGTPVALSGKISFCINDSFIYDPSLPNAGALGNLGSCADPTSLRGLDIGAVDEYDQTDPGQSISITGVPDGTYWLRALVDPDNFLAEKDKTNNETDTELTITGTTVQVLKTVTPTLNNPPAISMVSPANNVTVSRIVQLSATTAAGAGGVQFLIDGENFGSRITTAPYNLSWDTTTVPNGTHWLAAQTTDPTGIIGTSAVVLVNVANSSSTGPVVQLTDPAIGSILSATVTLYATVASSQSIANVNFFVDNVAVGSPVSAAPYMISWDTTAVPDGQHVITVSATDSLGNVGNSVPVTVNVDNSHPALPIGKDAMVSVDGVGTLTTTSFSTANASDLVIAFVATDGPAGSPQMANVSGAGLTWTLLERSNTQSGTAEIWAARADGTLSNVTVTALTGMGSYHGSLTVIAFTNAAGTSVVGRTGAPSGAPDIMLPGVIAGDWVFAVGNDWDNAIARTPSSGQVLVHQKLDMQVGDTYWVQSATVPSTANALVDIHDTAPTSDRWNYAAVEVVAVHQ